MANLYEELGVTKLINVHGNTTVIGGSIMPLEVLEAMANAADAFLDLDDLLKKAGQKIADMIGVEAACITSGGAGTRRRVISSGNSISRCGERHTTTRSPSFDRSIRPAWKRWRSMHPS